jgi:hypothetical protein
MSGNQNQKYGWKNVNESRVDEVCVFVCVCVCVCVHMQGCVVRI